MPVRTDSFDLRGLHLGSGAGRRLDLHVGIDPFVLGGERYVVRPALIPVKLDVSRTTGEGYALRLRFDATLSGPCMRCLEPAAPTFAVDSREVSQPGGDADLRSPYLDGEILDLRAWARDALALSLSTQVLCRPDCAGLCVECGANLNTAGPEHAHGPRQPDQRWAKLSELRLR
ncbi:MAG TPA: DUF177 domain-containing protein [Solirubrobacteraceae bacterium]|nr:DUF177 domain-containing protein [Solirubrobacteraceae bacterium]